MKLETESESRNRDGARGAAPIGPPTRALVVGDEEAMCALIKETLESTDIEAVTLTASAQAADHFQDTKFDVILVDLCAPPVEANKLVQRMRHFGFNRKTPIIMMSDDLRPRALSEGFRAGATFFVYKPVDRAHLIRMLRVTRGSIQQERRRFRRVPVRAKVRVRCGERSTDGETIDLSLSGALVRVSETFPVGSPIEIKLYLLEGNPPVAGLGSVMRVMNNNQMGIQIDRLPFAESGRLQDYLLPLAAI